MAAEVSGDANPADEASSGVGAASLLAVLRPLRLAVRSPWCFRGFAVLTLLVGAVGQLVDVLRRSNLQASRASHVAFGLVLLLTLSLGVFQVDAAGAGRDLIDFRRSLGVLKRLVYLLLYVLALVKEFLILGSYLWRGGAITLGSMVIGRQITDPTVGMEMSDDFGIYLLCGAAAIAFVPMAVALRSR